MPGPAGPGGPCFYLAVLGVPLAPPAPQMPRSERTHPGISILQSYRLFRRRAHLLGIAQTPVPPPRNDRPDPATFQALLDAQAVGRFTLYEFQSSHRVGGRRAADVGRDSSDNFSLHRVLTTSSLHAQQQNRARTARDRAVEYYRPRSETARLPRFLGALKPKFALFQRRRARPARIVNRSCADRRD